MATNKIGEGLTINYTATGDVTSGQIVLGTNACGIAVIAGATGDIIPVLLQGEYTVTKAAGAGEAMTFLDQVYAKATGGANVASATGTVPMGYASAAAATGATSVNVVLAPF